MHWEEGVGENNTWSLSSVSAEQWSGMQVAVEPRNKWEEIDIFDL